MRHAPAQLLAVVHQYYHRGIDPNYRNTPEYALLSTARKRAGSGPDYEHWRAMLDRLRVRFPDCKIANWSFHLPSGDHDGGYRGDATLPDFMAIGFYVSFLVPYYVIYIRCGDDEEREASLSFPDRAEPYALGIAAQIVASYPDYEPMPYEVGSIVVPDVARDIGGMGATIYDLLFSQHDRLALSDEDRRERAAFMKAYRAMESGDSSPAAPYKRHSE